MFTRAIPPLTSSSKKVVYAKPVPLVQEPEEDMNRIIRMCDTFVKQRYSELSNLLLRSGSWRQQPATDKQKAYIHKKLGGDTIPFLARIGPNVAVPTLTKGQANTALSLLKHGAKGRLDKLDKAYNKGKIKLAKEKEKEERMTIKVGRLGKAA